MRFQIIADSSLDVNTELEERLQVHKAPFRITVGTDDFIDDENIDVKDLMRKVAACETVAHTAAPAPYEFAKYVDPSAEGVFFITITSGLSAAFDMAQMACADVLEKYPHMKAAAIDSLSASTGETRLAYEMRKMESAGASFDDTLEHVLKVRDSDRLVFLLDNLETLRKNGRMSRLESIFASFLHIKPLLEATPDGQIGLFDRARTFKKALEKLAENIRQWQNKGPLLISHCNCPERAEELFSMLAPHEGFEEAHVMPMGGLSSIYANEGALIVNI
ncbi:MAG: DegV family protein [Eubacteriaceae bacterium]|nr:DegV family protein [Eubacteriaceae bacterium]